MIPIFINFIWHIFYLLRDFNIIFMHVKISKTLVFSIFAGKFENMNLLNYVQGLPYMLISLKIAFTEKLFLTKPTKEVQ